MSYRAYKDTEEMIADFKQRFGIKSDPDKPHYREPLIWVLNLTHQKQLIIHIDRKSVATFYRHISMTELKKEFTYLDGSVIGKEV